MRCYAALFYDYLEEMETLTDEEFGRLCRALLKYSKDGTLTELPGNEKHFFIRVRKNEDRAISAYEALSSSRSEAGKKGMAKRWHNTVITNDNSVISVITDDNKNNYIKNNNKNNNYISSSNEEDKCPFEKIKKLYHEICVSFPAIRTIDGNRKIAVAARWRTYKSLDTFTEAFKAVEGSSFLKGNNNRNWHADFDWIIKPTNFAKILEHKYDERESPSRENPPGDSFDTDEFFADALKKSYGG